MEENKYVDLLGNPIDEETKKQMQQMEAFQEKCQNAQGISDGVMLGMVDYKSEDSTTMTDEEFDQFTALLTANAKRNGFNSVQEQIKKTERDARKLDRFLKDNQNVIVEVVGGQGVFDDVYSDRNTKDPHPNRPENLPEFN